MAITYRSIKGSALTSEEVDTNFQELSDSVAAISGMSDVAYDATSWNANTDGATKNVLRDKIETLLPLSAGSSYPLSGALYANSGIDVTAVGGSDTLNIGTTNADIINIGRTGAVVNIQGTTLYENVTNLQVVDKLITLNKGGAASSGAGTGFEVEENNVVTSYIKTSAAVASGFDIKSRTSSYVATIYLSSLTGDHTYALPNSSGTFALTTDLGTYLPLIGGTLTGTLYLTEVGFNTQIGAGTLSIENTGATKGILAFGDTGGSNKELNISFNTLTDNRAQYFPDASGTFALNDDAAAFTNKTGFNGLVITANTGVITTGTWQGTVVAGQYGGTGVANTGKTITIGGNFVTSGAFATTLTVTATTNVTLPTTGTLATLAGAEALTNKTYAGSTATLSSLTSGRVTYAGTAGLLTDSANFTWDAATLIVKTSSGAATIRIDAANSIPGIDFYGNGSQVGQFKINTTECYFLANGSRNFIVYLGNSFYEAIKVLNNGRVGFGNVTAPAAMLDVLAGASTVGIKLQKHATGTDDLVALYNSVPTKITYIDYLGRLFITDGTASTAYSNGCASFIGGIGVGGASYFSTSIKVGTGITLQDSDSSILVNKVIIGFFTNGGSRIIGINAQTGANQAGTSLYVTSGAGTGSGAISDLIFQTDAPTTHTLTDRMIIGAYGIQIAASTAAASASNNSLVNDAGVLKWKDNSGVLNLLY